jgi:hypothetical protein
MGNFLYRTFFPPHDRENVLPCRILPLFYFNNNPAFFTITRSRNNAIDSMSCALYFLLIDFDKYKEKTAAYVWYKRNRFTFAGWEEGNDLSD